MYICANEVILDTTNLLLILLPGENNDLLSKQLACLS